MPQFGELESAVMDRVWTAGSPVRARDVLIELRREGRLNLAYTRVQAVMAILYRKGWLAREQENHVWRYSATAPRALCTAQLLDEALATAPDRPAALALFAQCMARDEADELRRVLDKVHARFQNGE
jgi:predicted transcriptional regulator